jgi:hypothetical protein
MTEHSESAEPGEVGTGYGLQLIGTNMLAETPALRLLYLLPFVWLIFASKKSRPKTRE